MIPDTIILHHSAGEDAPSLQWPGIKRYHTSYRIDGHIVERAEWERRRAAGEPGHFESAWADIGYHAGIELVGKEYLVMMGRPWDKPGAHCPGYNARALGFCFVGDFSLSAPLPEKLIDEAAKHLAFWCRLFNIKPENIRLHRELGNTKCPGEGIALALPKILRQMEFY